MEEPNKLVDRYINERGSNPMGKDYYVLIKNSLIVAGVIALALSYLVYEGYFKADCPEMNCPEVDLVCEKIDIPQCPACPSNNFSCPDNYNTCNFPEEININLNSS